LVTYGGVFKEPVALPTSLLIFKDVCAEGFWMTRWYAQCSDAERQAMTEEMLDLARKGLFAEP
ncbi:hypothetical protein BC829DRAFT_366665, partial [Chytridium lagenaria]